MKKRAATAAIVLVIIAALNAALAGCSIASPTSAPPATASAAAEPPANNPVYKGRLTVDVFAGNANYQGIQSGWMGKIINDKFNMELNIICPNVAGGGDTLFLTRSAAGNLGDIVNIYMGKLPDTVKAGLLLDITDLVQTHCRNYTSQFPAAVEAIKKYMNTDKVYALPTGVSTQSPLTPMLDGQNPQYGSYMRLDYYLGIGAPKMNTLDDLLPVLQQMQQKYPTSDSGKKTYGFSFFKDWDVNGAMQNSALFGYMYGWARWGSTCFVRSDSAETQSFIDDNGIYLKTLKMYFQANQMGLVDPDSTSQNWDMLAAKVKDGQVLFSWWSWLGISSFNNIDNSALSKGFALIPIADEKIYNDGINPNGDSGIAGIGSKAKDPERFLDFLDWMASPEGFQTIYNGPEGLSWNMKNGEPTLTNYGKTAFDKNSPVPAEYGGGNFADGANRMFSMILRWRGTEINPNTNYPYDYRLWPSTLANTATQLDKTWQSTFGASGVLDYLNSHNMIVVSPASNYTLPQDSTDVQTKRTQVSQAIVNASWKMIFAKDETEFYIIWQDMKAQATGLGFNDLYALDQKYARDMQTAREETLSHFKK